MNACLSCNHVLECIATENYTKKTTHAPQLASNCCYEAEKKFEHANQCSINQNTHNFWPFVVHRKLRTEYPISIHSTAHEQLILIEFECFDVLGNEKLTVSSESSS